MDAGRDFVKKIGPFGAALFLVLFIIVTVMLFTLRGTPVEGYSPPQSSDYYREHPDELAAELRDGLIPKLTLEGEVTVAEGASSVTVTGSGADLQTVRLAVIHYYKAELFEFITTK